MCLLFLQLTSMYVRVVFFLRPFARNFAPSFPRLLLASSRWVMLLLSPIAFPKGSTLVGGNFVSESTKAFSVFVLETYSEIPAAPEHPIDTPYSKKNSNGVVCRKYPVVLFVFVYPSERAL